MSTENTVKAELNRHINSKLFQKFLVKEAAKLPENVPKARPVPKSSIRKSPERVIRRDLENSDEELQKSAGRISSKSISYKESLMYRREPSPKQRSPLRFQSDLNKSHYDSPNGPRRDWKVPEDSPSYIPVYTADPLLLKQHENTIAKLKQESGKEKEKHENALRGKNEELRRIAKQLENSKIINGELLEKLEHFEENERKLAGVRTERDILERKLHSVESECDNYRRQLEYAKETADNYKGQIDEYERSSRNRTQDIERDLRNIKDRADDLERQLIREKERNQDLERKIIKAKDRGLSIQNELNRTEERNKRLERDLQEAKDRLTYESAQQLRDNENLRRKIEDLTEEIVKKEKRNSHYESRKEFSEPRQDFNEYPREKNERLSLPRKNVNEFRREDEKREVFEGFDRRSDPISWKKNDLPSPRNKNPENIKGLEGKLMALQMDKNRLDDELAKIPLQGRRIAQIKRKEEIELELEILNANITTVKSKLRQANAL